jgi:hypothetical protein
VANKKSSWAKQAGITPGKLVLIAVLAVVLGGVLYIQFAPQSSSSPPPSHPVPPTVAAARKLPVQNLVGVPALPSETATLRKKTGEVASWHSPELTPIVAYDPFALPAAFPQPTKVDEQGGLAQSEAAVDPSVQQAELEAERTKSESELAGLREQGVAVVIKKKKEWYAIVGDQEIHVGDQINGFTVIAIDAGGVRVAKDLSP